MNRYGGARSAQAFEVGDSPSSRDFRNLSSAANSDRTSTENPFLVPRGICLSSELKNAAAAIKALTEYEAKLEAQASKSPVERVALAAEATSKFAAQTLSSISALAALPAPGSERDVELTKTLVAFNLAGWQKKAPSGTEALFLELQQRRFGAQAKIEWPEWLVPLASIVTATPAGKGFPDREAYLPFSNAVSSDLITLNGQRGELRGKIADLTEKNTAALARIGKGKGPHVDVINSLSAQLLSLDQSVIGLFDRVNDLDPATVTDAANALGIRVAPHPLILNELIRAAASIEKILAYSAIVGTTEASSTVTLRTPVYRVRGKIETVQTEFEPQDLKSLWSSPKNLIQLIEAWREVRHSIAGFFPMLPNSVVQPSDFEKVRDPLLRPMGKFADAGTRAFEALMQHSSADVRRAFAELLAEPYLVDSKQESWTTLPAHIGNFKVLAWAVRETLDSATDEQSRPFMRLLGANPAREESLVGPLRIICPDARTGNVSAVSTFLNERLERLEKGSDPFEVIGVLTALHHLAIGKFGERFKHQFPSLEQLKLIPEILGRSGRELDQWSAPLVRASTRALTATLEDFLNFDSGKGLAECLENFRFYMENPELLEGVPGNVAMKGGIALNGDPGVGKTYVVDCIVSDLGIKELTISPEHLRKEGETMIMVAKKQINEAKELSKAKKFCLLFIDEAEAYLAERSNPNISPQKEEIADYLLQEINDIRVNHPRIFLVVATNFLPKLDEAVLRPGRLDYVVDMVIPDAPQREGIIRSTIVKHKIPVELDDEQIAELVKLSDQFIPLIITRTLISEKILGMPKRKAKGEKPDLTFELYKEKFTAEAKDYKALLKRREQKRAQFDKQGAA